jgi:5-methylcytosine-specific restriction endonuclease McrA
MLSRQNVFRRDGNKCIYCGSHDDLTLDHVLPKSRGGKTNWDNLVTACRRCNSRKGDLTPEEMGFSLPKKPYKPSFIMFLRDFAGSIEENWLPFLGTKERA